MDLTVVVATFGDRKWSELACRRAVPSAEPQAPVVHVHLDTLANARNAGAEQATSEWLCFLDADDELEPGYVEAMAAGTADLRAPLVRYVSGHRHAVTQNMVPDDWVPEMLRDGNHFVIGTLLRRSMFLEVGGFKDWPMYEDWCLWQRCWLAGASFEVIHGAVYRAHVRQNSRNRSPSRQEKEATHHMIRRANLPHLYEDVA